jgi:hypothetical protein
MKLYEVISQYFFFIIMGAVLILRYSILLEIELGMGLGNDGIVRIDL